MDIIPKEENNNQEEIKNTSIDIQSTLKNLPTFSKDIIKNDEEEEKPKEIKNTIKPEDTEIKTRGRKPKEKIENIDLGVPVRMVFNFLAKWRGKHWELEKEELEDFIKNTNEVFRPFLSKIKYIKMYLWSLELFLILMPRLQEDFKLIKERKKIELEKNGK